jgi:hypothetical protein
MLEKLNWGPWLANINNNLVITNTADKKNQVNVFFYFEEIIFSNVGKA